MDIEQLKLVLETIKGLGDSAQSVAIWYFVLDYGLSLLKHLAWLTAIVLVVQRIVCAVNFADKTASDARVALSAIGEFVGKEPRAKYGYLGGFERWDYLDIVRAVKERCK